MKRIPIAALALALVATVEACARPEDVASGFGGGLTIPVQRTAAPQSGDAWTSCQATMSGTDAFSPPVDRPLLSTDFEASGVVVCDEAPEKNSAGGEDMVAYERRGEKIAALVAALRLLDEPPTNGYCTMELRGVRWFALLDAAGHWVRPGVPVDGCGKVRMEVVDAANALEVKDVSRQVVGVIVSAEAAAAGCSQQWGDMVWAESAMSPGRDFAKPDRAPFAADASVRLCVYAVPPSERGSAKPGGTFESGRVLSAETWATIATAVAQTTPAKACTTPASRFALLRQTNDLGGEIYVELDACQRVMVEGMNGSTLGQADASLIAALGA
jgi:hypothetical protein